MLMYTNSKNSFIKIEHRLNYITFKLKSRIVTVCILKRGAIHMYN